MGRDFNSDLFDLDVVHSVSVLLFVNLKLTTSTQEKTTTVLTNCLVFVRFNSCCSVLYFLAVNLGRSEESATRPGVKRGDASRQPWTLAPVFSTAGLTYYPPEVTADKPPFHPL